MPGHDATTFQPGELLDALKEHRFLAPFRLSVVCRDETGISLHAGWELCAAATPSPLCARVCHSPLKEPLAAALSINQPVTFRCPLGLLAFAVPLLAVGAPLCCLVGSGVREHSLDLFRLEAVSRLEGIDPIALMENLEGLPAMAATEAEKTAHRLFALLPTLRKGEPHSQFIEKTTERLNAIVRVSADIDRADTVDAAVSLMSEALGILFDVPAIASVLPERGGARYTVQCSWGHLPPIRTTIAPGRLRQIASRGEGMVILDDSDLAELFPGVRTSRVTCLPLASGDELFGLVALFGRELHTRDLLLTELVTGRLTARLRQLKKETDYGRESSRAGRLMAMISTLALTEEAGELAHRILEMGADLVHATSGSLMLLDEGGETLRIESALGMNPSLARSLSIRVGKGIAGTVAASGEPLLVNDIEKSPLATGENRPRFRTKSFVSVPFSYRNRLLGVLNLADKQNHGTFTDVDLEMLTAFLGHAAAMFARAQFLARAELLERLSLTDPLTELYNRRFLEKRLDEEINRSYRQKLSLIVMFVAIDHFRLYNEFSGYATGDRALRQAARLLVDAVREMDLVTRHEGDVFCVLLPATPKKEAIFVAERIRRGIECEHFAGEEHLPGGRLTASIGLVSYPEDGRNPAGLFDAAAEALRRAKADGRNRIAFAVVAEEAPAPKQSAGK